ncbi:hypothetical protein [Streptomyces sp. NPDC054834]
MADEVRGHRMHRERRCDLFWPDLDQTAASNAASGGRPAIVLPERGRLAEGRRRLDDALAAAPAPAPQRARALMGKAGLAIRLGDGSQLEDIGAQIVAIHRRRPDAAEVVTTDGRVVRADEHANSELFWALRGGGNLGVVTSFEYQLHPVGPQILGGLIVYPFAQARQAITGWRELIANMPDELTTLINLTTAPPLPFLPPRGARHPRPGARRPVLRRPRGR